jgi:hypothetical protein
MAQSRRSGGQTPWGSKTEAGHQRYGTPELHAELSRHIDRAEASGADIGNSRADLDALMSDPRLRESFTRSVFAADQTLPDMWRIRATLRGSR